MRTLGSEAGRSEERAARRPTWLRNRASACWASPARRVHGAKSLVCAHRVCFFVWFLSCGQKGFF